MEDNKIIEVLECCAKMNCKKCPKPDFSKEFTKGLGCNNAICRQALDLIKRQQAEIERLNSLCTSKDVIINSQEAEIERLKEYPKCAYEFDGEVMDYCLKSPCSNFKAENEIKAEAIKEFAEMVKQSQRKLFNLIYSEREFDNEIDNLVKEMKGE